MGRLAAGEGEGADALDTRLGVALRRGRAR